MAARRRFPPPWRIEEGTESFAIMDATGFVLAYVYFAEEQRASVMGRMLRDEARRIAVNMARLPDLLGAHPPPGTEPETKNPPRPEPGG